MSQDDLVVLVSVGALPSASLMTLTILTILTTHVISTTLTTHVTTATRGDHVITASPPPGDHGTATIPVALDSFLGPDLDAPRHESPSLPAETLLSDPDCSHVTGLLLFQVLVLV